MCVFVSKTLKKEKEKLGKAKQRSQLTPEKNQKWRENDKVKKKEERTKESPPPLTTTHISQQYGSI